MIVKFLMLNERNLERQTILHESFKANIKKC